MLVRLCLCSALLNAVTATVLPTKDEWLLDVPASVPAALQLLSCATSLMLHGQGKGGSGPDVARQRLLFLLRRRQFVAAALAAVAAAGLPFDHVVNRVAACSLQVGFSTVVLLFVSLLWSVAISATEAYPENRTTWFGRMSAAGTVGSIAGSLLVRLLTNFHGRVSTLVATLVMIECVILLLGSAPTPTVPTPSDSSTPTSSKSDSSASAIPTPASSSKNKHSWDTLRGSSLLVGLFVSVCLYGSNSVSQLLYRNRLVRLIDVDRAAYRASIATYAGVGSVLQFLLQLTATDFLLKNFSHLVNASLLPLSRVFFFAALASGWYHFRPDASAIDTLLAIEVTFKTMHASISKPVREVAYSLVSQEERDHCKGLVDSSAHRIGGALTALAFTAIDTLPVGLTALLLPASHPTTGTQLSALHLHTIVCCVLSGAYLAAAASVGSAMEVAERRKKND